MSINITPTGIYTSLNQHFINFSSVYSGKKSGGNSAILIKAFFALIFLIGWNNASNGAKYYVSSSSGSNANTTVQAQNPASPWQTVAFAITQAALNDSIVVLPGNYAETNLLVTKGLKIFGNETAGIPGTGPKPVFETPVAPVNSCFFSINSANVLIKNFDLRVNQTNVIRGIFAPGPGFNQLRIEDNDIFSTNGSAIQIFNSFGIMLGQPTSPASSDSVVIVRNIIRPLNNGNAIFGRGIRMVGGFGRIGGSNLADSNQIRGIYAIQSGDANRRIQILNNHIFGTSAGLELNIPAPNQVHLVSGNVFEINQGIEALAMIELKNNIRTNSVIRIENNRFVRFPFYGIFSTRSRNVEVLSNTFTPADTAKNYVCVAANTKQQSSANDAPLSSSIVVKGNTLNGSGILGGTGISFQNYNFGTGVVPFENVAIGGPGSEANLFGSNIRVFVSLDSASGNSKRIPLWNQSSYPTTQMRPVNINLNLEQNQFNLGSGPKLPANLSESELMQLENRLNHGIDFDSLGFLTVIPNEAFVTITSFLSPKTTVPSIQRAVNLAADGWNIHAEPGTYPETVSVNKTLNLDNEPNAEVILQGLTMTGAGKVLSVADPVSISNTLNLNAGLINLGSNNLRIGSAATISGGSAASYVRTSGAGLLVISAIQSARTFPIGTATSYFPTILSNSGSTDDFGLRVLNNVFDAGTTGNPVDSALGVTWVASENLPGGSNLTLTATWSGGNEKPQFNRASTALQAFGSNWTTISGPSGIAATGSDPYQAVFSNLTANLSNTPLRIKNFQAPATPGNLYYVDDASGDDSRSNNDAKNPNTPWKTIGKALASVADGDSVQVFAATYNESNLAITKKVKLFGNVVGIGTGPGAGTGVKPVVNGNSATPNGGIYLVQSQEVLIKNFEIQVNQFLTNRGIFATAGGFNGLRIEDNLIVGTNTSAQSVFGSYGIQLGQLTSSAGLDSFVIVRNVIRPRTPTSALFGRGIRLVGGFGRIGGTSLADSNFIQADYAIQAGSIRATFQLLNNSLFGRASGLELNVPAANLTHRISGNTFRPVPGFDALSMIELKNNTQANSNIEIENNQFRAYSFYGLFSTRSRNVTVRNNVFSPRDTSRNYSHIVVNTKQQTTGNDAPTNSSISVFGNTFNGASALGGNGIVFQNYQSGANPPFTNIQIGGPGALANNFQSTIKSFVALDSASGNSRRLPLWSQTGYPATVMLPANVDLDLSQNNFDVGTGAKLPGVMSTDELLNLEDKMVHAIDFDSLGFLTVVPNEAFVTSTSFLAPKSTFPSIQRAVNKASDGWFIRVRPFNYFEVLNVTKTLSMESEPNTETGLQGLTMNGAGKVFSLIDPVRVSNSLNLSDGFISLADADLSLSTGSLLTGGSQGSYIRTTSNGKLVQDNVSTIRNFPIGTSTSYFPVAISNAGTADNIGLRVQPDVLSSGLTGTPVNNVVGATWVINEGTSGGSNLSITPQWNESTEKTGFTRNNCTLQGFTGLWTNQAGIVPFSATGSDPYQVAFPSVTSNLNNLPLRVGNFDVQNPGTIYYVDDNTGQDTRTNVEAQDPNTPWRTISKALASVANGDSIQVFAGTYNEANLNIDKSVLVFGNVVGIGKGVGAGTGAKPIVNGSGLNADSSIFTVRAEDVLIQNFQMEVNQGLIIQGILARNGDNYNRVRIIDNRIVSAGLNPGPIVLPCLRFNTYGIRLVGFSTDSFQITGNSIEPLVLDGSRCVFGRGIKLFGGHGRIGGNDADSNRIFAYYDIQAGDIDGGKLLIDNNFLVGIGVQIVAPAANTGIHEVKRNNIGIPGQFGGFFPKLVELKDIQNTGTGVAFFQNIVAGHAFAGVFAQRSRNLTIENNVFLPGDTARNYRHIILNTKQETLASNQPPVASSMVVKGNTFGGNNATNAGTGLEFGNHNDDPASIPAFAGVVIGGTGAEANTFDSRISKFMVLDPLTGPSASNPFWSAYPNTPMGPVRDNFDIQENLFGVSGGSKRPANMTDAEQYELENKVVHGIDYDSLGFVTWKPTFAFVTNNSFLAPFTTTPSLQRAVNIAPVDGWQINMEPNLINETVLVNKSITWNTFPLDSIRLGGINMNGLSKTLTLSDRFILLNNLTLNNPNGGNIRINASDLVVLPTTAVTTGSPNSYVITEGTGGFIRRGVDAQPALFPVGTNDSYAPMTFDDANNTGDNFKVNVRAANTIPDFTPPLPPTINTFVKFQWTVCEDVTGGSNAQLIFDWQDPSNISGGGTLNAISRNDGVNWNSSLATIGPGLTARALFTNFCSPFAVLGDPNLTSIVTEPIIKIGAGIAGRFCNGDSIKIPVTVVGTGLVPTNVFNAFLSLPNGTFPANGGVLIGSKIGNVSDTLIGVIPVGTTPGNQYRIRVVSTNISITGAATIDSLAIFGLPARPTLSGDSTLCPGESTTITSSAALNYFWIPGGENTASVTRTSAGPNRVRITDANGCNNTSATLNVSISQAPVAEPITANGALVRCAGDSVTLTANPAGLTYEWINTNPLVTTRNIVVKTSGTFQVILTNSAGCKDTSASVQTTFNPLPAKPAVSSPNPNICQPGPLTFNTGPGFTYDWTISGITPNPSTQSVDITEPGSYTATVTITDANGCKNTSDPFNGSLRKAPAIPVIGSQGNDLSVCEGSNIVLIPQPFSPGNTYTWTPGNLVTANFIVSALGQTSVGLQVDSNGCSRTAVGVVANINPRPQTPVASIILGSNSFCAGSSATLGSSVGGSYLWTPGNQTSQNISVSNPGNYSVVILTDSGCQSLPSNAIAIEVRKLPVKPEISANTTVFCFGESANLQVNNVIPSTTYTWPDGQTGTPITVSVSGTYFARADSNACSSFSDTIQIIQNPLPEPVITAIPADFQVCERDSVILFSNLANGNSWNLNPIATTSQIVLKSTRNNIVLTVTDANGCVASTPPVSVVVDTLPVVTLLKDTALVFGEDIDLVASNFSANAQSFSWLLNGLQIGNSSLPSFGIEPTATATYSVILTDSNGCRASDSVLIRVARELYVPNMFSPNKDGNNDRFKVYGFGIASIEVKVWDRLGNLVYETNRVEDIVESSIDGDSVPGWDGTYKGKELSQESFIWNVKGKLTTGEDLKVNGGKNSGSVIIMN